MKKVKTRKVEFLNRFHNTVCTLRVQVNAVSLSNYQFKRVNRELCGIDGCQCPSPESLTEDTWYLYESAAARVAAK